MKAAILREAGVDLSIESFELPALNANEVRVRVVASGVCHSDLSHARGLFGKNTPVILGHEGAGVVEEVGASVTLVEPGQRVILAWQAPCRTCPQCLAGQAALCTGSVFEKAVRSPRAQVDGALVPAMNGLGTFATHTIVPEEMVIPFADEHSFEVAALVGCAVMTGVGAVINTAKVKPGDTVAVVGCGGVGLSAIQGARLAGARRIIAIDRREDKRTLSLQHGATDTVDAEDAKLQVSELTGGVGVDHAFDCVGIPATIRSAYDIARIGGTVTIVGIGPMTEPLPLVFADLLMGGKTLRFSRYGDADARRDFPKLLDLNARGLLDLDMLIGKRIPLSGVNEALSAVASGESVRTVIMLDE